MASVVSAVLEVRAVAALASGSIVSVRASTANSSLSMVSCKRVVKSGSSLWATQECRGCLEVLGPLSTSKLAFTQGRSSVSMVHRKSVRPARRLRVSAVEGSQTAEPEAVVAETVKKEGKKPHNDAGKSTIDIVREVIAEQLAVKLTDLEADTAFVDLGADSLDTVEIMMNLEERFDIAIEEDGTEKIATVLDAANLIDQVKASK